MAEVGMDADVVRGLSSKLDVEAGRIATVVGDVDRLLSGIDAEWLGRDADQFIGWWRQQHRGALLTLHDAVAGLAQSVRNNASAQDTASSSSGGAAVGVAVGAGGVAVAAGGAAAVSGGAAAGGSAPSAGAPTLDGYAAACQKRGWDSTQCAIWAAYRRDQLGLPEPHGNGNQMAGSVGLVSDPSQIHQGSLVSVPGSAKNRYGHVMVVEQVVSPGHYVVSEMNWDGKSTGSWSSNSELVQAANGSWRHSVGAHSQTWSSVEFSK